MLQPRSRLQTLPTNIFRSLRSDKRCGQVGNLVPAACIGLIWRRKTGSNEC